MRICDFGVVPAKVNSLALAGSRKAFAAATTIQRVVIRANPKAYEYVCAVSTYDGTSFSRLWVYTWDNGTWTQNWSAQNTALNTAAMGAFQWFDIAYEQNSGDCMVVYSNGATTNELSYRRRVDGVWAGASSTINSNRTTGAVEWVRIQSRPNSNEIALAFSDANDDLNAFIWFNDGATYSWQAEPAAILTNNLSTNNVPKFDIAYEQVSGDVLLTYSLNATTDLGYATKLAGASAWTNSTYAATTIIADSIDSCPEPGTNYIAVGYIAYTARDLEVVIWNGDTIDTHLAKVLLGN